MTSDAQEEPLTPVAPQPAPARPKPLTSRERRRRRRKSRHRGEEILGWILVPVILFGLFWGVNAVLEAMGTSPGVVWDQLLQVKAALEKKM
ncbi:MAG: hypothetical protein ACAH20_10605 [Methylobacteriaceae bacterium]|jgi:hypothetical protein|uniref:Uncharacterized protein n=2 Tax=Methylorubrum extorquens TaxID=408 RepID=C5AV76_METEA|nr:MULTISPECIES: hypothetical protein [Methylorubrum]KQO78006.1 hypothetical protein ASF36_13235 [Methylobacterium sp. Leaf90]ACS42862.1 hypothetical protein MexAM1_META1p5260 [Methylorubrum extorquens AM1]APX84653.1 hypothetical protein BV511_07975 [Methylorubrum extorquens]EHP92036.1 hypothetical protein MetexDRAFT_3086 [Methylorubrum extorquens DSM 13060]MCP1544071.1 hypothetical protein [Methylorubrum extorquens]